MRQLYFDIECSDGAHICSFGYVIADMDFNVLEKKDILINPNSIFKLGKDALKPEIDLAYSEETFRVQKEFDYYYDTIKDLLLYEDQIVLGHGITSDLMFLNVACNRYNCKRLDLKVVDTQNLYYQFKKEKKCTSLEQIAQEMNISLNNLVQHKSCDDAEISMLVAKEICSKMEVSILELIKICGQSVVNNDLLPKTLREKLTKLSLKTSPNNKTICLSDTIETKSNKSFYNLAKLIQISGYNYTIYVSKCDYFVEGNSIGELEEEYLSLAAENNCKIKKLSLNELAEMLGVEENVDILSIDEDYVRDHQKADENSAMNLALKKAFEQSHIKLDDLK